ncbi:MAG: hypothetical protein FWG77_04055 [Treponema sp.]|nr:hypothetical protein [Treponema sp.]
MTRGILIVGGESPLLSAIAGEAGNRVEAFTAAIIQNRVPDVGEKIPLPEKAMLLPWNPASPISARTLVFSAENRMKQIHEAILVSSPPVISKNADSLSPEEIEILVNDHIKGWFLLARELILCFRRRGFGYLYFVENDFEKSRGAPRGVSRAGGLGGDSRGSGGNLLGQTAASSFKTLAASMLGPSLNESFQAMGFSASRADSPEKVAAWIFKKIDESTQKDSGKWLRYSRRFWPFG